MRKSIAKSKVMFLLSFIVIFMVASALVCSANGDSTPAPRVARTATESNWFSADPTMQYGFNSNNQWVFSTDGTTWSTSPSVITDDTLGAFAQGIAAANSLSSAHDRAVAGLRSITGASRTTNDLILDIGDGRTAGDNGGILSLGLNDDTIAEWTADDNVQLNSIYDIPSNLNVREYEGYNADDIVEIGEASEAQLGRGDNPDTANDERTGVVGEAEIRLMEGKTDAEKKSGGDALDGIMGSSSVSEEGRIDATNAAANARVNAKTEYGRGLAGEIIVDNAPDSISNSLDIALVTALGVTAGTDGDGALGARIALLDYDLNSMPAGDGRNAVADALSASEHGGKAHSHQLDIDGEFVDYRIEGDNVYMWDEKSGRWVKTGWKPHELDTLGVGFEGRAAGTTDEYAAPKLDEGAFTGNPDQPPEGATFVETTTQTIDGVIVPVALYIDLETGAVAYYKIEVYPEGHEHAGQPKMAGDPPKPVPTGLIGGSIKQGTSAQWGTYFATLSEAELAQWATAGGTPAKQRASFLEESKGDVKAWNKWYKENKGDYSNEEAAFEGWLEDYGEGGGSDLKFKWEDWKEEIMRGISNAAVSQLAANAASYEQRSRRMEMAGWMASQIMHPSAGANVIGEWMATEVFGWDSAGMRRDELPDWMSFALEGYETKICDKRRSEAFIQDYPGHYQGGIAPGITDMHYITAERVAFGGSGFDIDWSGECNFEDLDEDGTNDGARWFPKDENEPMGYLYKISWYVSSPISQAQADEFKDAGICTDEGLDANCSLRYKLIVKGKSCDMATGQSDAWSMPVESSTFVVPPGGVSSYSLSIYDIFLYEYVCIDFMGYDYGPEGDKHKFWPANCAQPVVETSLDYESNFQWQPGDTYVGGGTTVSGTTISGGQGDPTSPSSGGRWCPPICS